MSLDLDPAQNDPIKDQNVTHNISFAFFFFCLVGVQTNYCVSQLITSHGAAPAANYHSFYLPRFEFGVCPIKPQHEPSVTYVAGPLHETSYHMDLDRINIQIMHVPFLL